MIGIGAQESARRLVTVLVQSMSIASGACSARDVADGGVIILVWEESAMFQKSVIGIFMSLWSLLSHKARSNRPKGA